MNSICFISSNYYEIEQFKIVYPNEKNIISDIEGYISPSFDVVNTVLSSTDICIIGETVNFSDNYISRILLLCEEKRIKVFNYHVSISTCNSPMQRIKIPVIYVCSLLPDMSKSKIGFELAEVLAANQYKPLFISSNPMWQLYNHEVFPYEILKSNNPIYELNRFISDKINKCNVDILVLCIPGGIISSNKYNPFCDYGLLNYLISRAVKPTYVLNCVHQNTANISEIPEPFYPYKINQHIRTDKILDQNEYDFYLNNRNITVTKDMSEYDELFNLFDASVFSKIAEDISNFIDNGE